MCPVLNVILSHQSPPAVAKMIAEWGRHASSTSLLLAYGGPRADFDAIEHSRKFFVDDPRLRTRDHQREYQSYSGIFRGAAELLRMMEEPVEFVHFAEFDHLPLVSDLNERQMERINRERADLLGFHVRRVDGTSYPHFLYHASNPEFARYWQQMTRRDDSSVVLSMFGSGSFWRWEAFCAIAETDEPFPIYMEIYLPTLAHHRGFRVRDFAEQNQFVHPLGDRTRQIAEAREAGAWTLHPVKRLWSR